MTGALRLVMTAALTAGLALSLGTSLGTPVASAIPVDRPAQSATVSSARPAHPVAAARLATRKYRSLDRAKDDGFARLVDKDGIACIDMPGMGGMGVHFVDGDRVANPQVRIRKPEALVYARRDGRRRLVALEYVVLRRDWRAAQGKDAPRPRLYGRRFDLTGRDNRFGLPPFYSLHAWVWKANPAGRFAPFNPDLKCHCHGHTH